MLNLAKVNRVIRNVNIKASEPVIQEYVEPVFKNIFNRLEHLEIKK